MEKKWRQAVNVQEIEGELCVADPVPWTSGTGLTLVPEVRRKGPAGALSLRP